MSHESTQDRTQKRDYEIYTELKRIYELEWERTDTLNEKSIRLVTSAGTIMALYMGLGTFTLEHISPSNSYYPWLTMMLMLGLTLFIGTILFGLWSYNVASYLTTDPRDFIEEYEERD